MAPEGEATLPALGGGGSDAAMFSESVLQEALGSGAQATNRHLGPPAKVGPAALAEGVSKARCTAHKVLEKKPLGDSDGDALKQGRRAHGGQRDAASPLARGIGSQVSLARDCKMQLVF